MTNVITENDKTMAKKSENKVCAILYPITAALWLFCAGMQVYDKFAFGNKLGWNFVMYLALALLWGCIAVDYIRKYRKEKKEGEKNEYIA